MAKNVQMKSDARAALGRVMRGESGPYGYLFSYLSSTRCPKRTRCGLSSIMGTRR
jgi:hypothetical protein